MGGVELHPAAAAGFERGAEDYERGRPSFPAAAVDAIAAHLGLHAGATVADLGAGTGKLTRLLVETGADVVAVEPVRAMRALLPITTPGASAVGGVAEAIPLRDGSLAGITVAQAFHWFEAERAIEEIHRVLVAGGGMALLWNERDRAVEWQSQLKDLMTEVAGPDMLRYKGGAGVWEEVLAADERFTPVEMHSFPNAITLDRETFAARIRSTSYVSILPEAEREEVVQRALDLLPPEEPFVESYLTEVHLCSRRR